MFDKPRKRLKGSSTLTYDAMDTAGRISENEEQYAHCSAPSSFGKIRNTIYSKQGVSNLIFIIKVTLLIVITVASFATPAESSLIKPVLPNNHNVAAISRVEELIEEELKSKTGEIFPWKDIRLPSFIIPVHYDLFIFPNLKTSENIGNVNITFKVTTQRNFIVLHSKELNLTNLSVTESNEKEIPVLQYLEYPKHEQLYIKIDGNFMPDLEYKLSIDFEAYLKVGKGGFYLSFYVTTGGQKRYLATTNFEPTAARSAFPCFDEPAMKATFQLSIAHDENYKAYFNSEALQTTPYGGGFSITSFRKTPKMSTYLVAFMVCDFKERQITNTDGINIRVLVPAEHYAETELALEMAADLLHFYKTFFDASYPLSKFDVAAVPKFAAGATKNWGLATFAMNSVLNNPSEASTESQGLVASIISQKLVHQWFGNLVTVQWWNYFWLYEGFASFLQAVALDNIRPDWNTMDEFVVETTQVALSLDSLQISHPIITDATDPLEIKAAFDFISSKKGAAILNMLAGFLGKETFKKGLSIYLNKYSFQNARATDLWNTLSEVDPSHINVSQIMDTWTRQKGYPLITVTLEHTAVKVKQQRYRATALESDDDPSTDESLYGYKWFVPITYVTDLSDKQNVYWLNMTDGEFTLPVEAKWLKVNVNQTGFYRVMYDNDLWKALTDLLHSNHKILTTADRANLVDDALSFSRSGNLENVLAFNLTHYLEKEDQFAVWERAIMRFEQLYVLMQNSPLLYSLFQKYMVKLLKPTVNTLGWEDKGSHMEKKLRSIALAASVYYGDEQTISKAIQIYQNWMQNGEKVPPNLRSAVYNAGVKYGGKEEWEFCWNQYQKAQPSSEKNLLLTALGTTQDASLIAQYLNYSMDTSKIRPQDRFTAISVASNNPIGRSITWKFVQEHWPLFLRIYGRSPFAMTIIITETTSHFNTQSEYNEAESFFSGENVGSGTEGLKTSLEMIKSNIKWREEAEASLTQWLQQTVN